MGDFENEFVRPPLRGLFWRKRARRKVMDDYNFAVLADLVNAKEAVEGRKVTKGWVGGLHDREYAKRTGKIQEDVQWRWKVWVSPTLFVPAYVPGYLRLTERVFDTGLAEDISRDLMGHSVLKIVEEEMK